MNLVDSGGKGLFNTRGFIHIYLNIQYKYTHRYKDIYIHTSKLTTGKSFRWHPRSVARSLHVVGTTPIFWVVKSKKPIIN